MELEFQVNIDDSSCFQIELTKISIKIGPRLNLGIGYRQNPILDFGFQNWNQDCKQTKPKAIYFYLNHLLGHIDILHIIIVNHNQ